jgi:hypothetical protein
VRTTILALVLFLLPFLMERYWERVASEAPAWVGHALSFVCVLLGIVALLMTDDVFSRWWRYGDKFTPLGSTAIIALAGAVASGAAWWFLVATWPKASSHVDTPKPDPHEQVLFLLEAAKPLKSARLLLDLKQSVAPETLGHFRALVTIYDLREEARYSQAEDSRDPHASLQVGGRDAYATAHFDNRERKLFGVMEMVWARNPIEVMQDTMVGVSASAAYIELGGQISGKGPFKTIADLEDCFVRVYFTRPLLPYVRALWFIANDYVLFSADTSTLVVVNEPDQKSVPWLHQLSDAESAVEWISVIPKGSDYDRYNAEQAAMGGDSPDWFPANYHAPWNLEFAKRTPKRMVRNTRN